MMPTIEWEGLKELEKLVEDMPDMAVAPAEKAMGSAIAYLHGRIPAYPPALPNSNYIRTGTLGRRITGGVEAFEGEVTGVLGMLTPYAPWVVGDDRPGTVINGEWMYQKTLFKRRGWWQFNKVIAKNIDGAWDEFTEVFLKLFQGSIHSHS